jgi:large subunit ribosomal protein L15
MPLQRRLPKRGFNNIFKKEYALVSLSQLDVLGGDQIITVETLVAAGVVKKGMLVKVLANGKVTNSLKIQVDKISKAAQDLIEAAGGTVIAGDQKEA